MPTALSTLMTKLLPGDAQPVFRVQGATGTLEWGPGGATAIDTNLFRSSAGLLRTQQNLMVDGTLYMGNASDVTLIRSSGAKLTTTLTTHDVVIGAATYRLDNLGWQEWWSTESYPRIRLSRDASGAGVSGLSFGAGAALDTFIYRGVAANVYIDSTLRTIGSIVVNQGAAQQYIYFGSALDTYIYRRAASQLGVHGLIVCDGTVYGSFGIAQQATLGDHGRGVGEVQFGNAADACLYRSSQHWINHYSPDGAWGGFNAAVFQVNSDRRLKDEIEPADVPVEQMLKTGIYSYKLHKHEGRHLGLMAEELPDVVTGEGANTEGEVLQFVDLYKLSTAILATVQHLDERVKALEAK